MNDTQTVVQLNEPVNNKVSLGLDRHIVIDTAVILAAVVVIFGRTLTNYFLADDFGEVHYISKIFEGNLSMLLANFTGNYMQIPGMSVYRPFLLVSLMLDFLFWRGNAFGYYLTNVSFYFFDAVLLYFIVRQLASDSGTVRSRLTALGSSLLFACSPLHCESVSWILGRVDIVCAFYYLLSLWLMIKSLTQTSPRWTYFALAAYMCGMLVKEMAIGIPVLALGLGVLFKAPQASVFSRAQLLEGLRFARPYVVTTCVYFLVRYLCLGTLVGGYVAGFGATQEANLVMRWLDPDTIKRIAFPLVVDHFSNEKAITLLLTVFYAMTASLFLLKLAAGKLPVKLFAFLLVWIFSTLLPIYKLWGLGYHLEGARFIYFFTLPMSALFACALFQENGSGPKSSLLVSAAVAIGCLAVYGCVATKTNLIWVNAGKEAKAAAVSARRILAENTPQEAVFLGIPQEWKGSHMILNGDTFRAAVNPPFASQKPVRPYETFEPIMYSPNHDLDAPRLKTAIAGGARVFAWNRDKREFVPVVFSGEGCQTIALTADNEKLETDGLFKRTATTVIRVNDAGQTANPTLIVNNLNINPSAVDYLAVRLSASDLKAAEQISAAWSKNGEEETSPQNAIAELAPQSHGEQTLYLPLSQRWTWYKDGVIKKLYLHLPGNYPLTLSQLSLMKAEDVAPNISLTGVRSNENGVYSPASKGTEVFAKIDASRLKGAQSLILQISKPNYFFDNFKTNDGAEAVATTMPLPSNCQQIKLISSLFKGHGFFQIRARALGQDHKPIMANSRSLTLQLH